MEIEAHTMNHLHLNKLSATALNYEIGGSKHAFLTMAIMQQFLDILLIQVQTCHQ